MAVSVTVRAPVRPTVYANRLVQRGSMTENQLDQEVTKKTARGIWAEAKRYDAPPVPGYTRTGKMSRETVMKREGDGWTVIMRAPYSVYVRGSLELPQAWMHAGRWKAFRMIVNEHMAESRQETNRALLRVIKKTGLA